MKPSDLKGIHPWNSVTQKGEDESSMAWLVMKMAEHGNRFRAVTYQEYKEVFGGTKFEDAFNSLARYATHEHSICLFSKSYQEVFDRVGPEVLLATDAKSPMLKASKGVTVDLDAMPALYSKLIAAIKGIDFVLLRRQKTDLLEILDISGDVTSEQRSSLDGVIQLLDGMCDVIVSEGIMTEEEVFGLPSE